MLLLNTSTLRALGVFRKWRKHRNIPIRDTYSYLRPSIYLILPIFHVIKRCDTTSHFLGCGNNISWAIHQDSLTNEPSCFALRYLDVQNLGRFVVFMYSKGRVLAKVREARHDLLQMIVALFEQEIPEFRYWDGKGIQWYLVTILENTLICQ